MEGNNVANGFREQVWDYLRQSMAPGHWYVCFLTADGQEVITRHYSDEESAETTAALLRDALKDSPHNQVLVVSPGTEAMRMNGSGAPKSAFPLCR